MKIAQSAEDFHNRLNMQTFTNLEKSHTREDIANEFGEDAMILEKGIIDSYVQEVFLQSGGEIVKGKFNDTPEVAAYLEKAQSELSELTQVTLIEQGITREVFIMKAKPASNDFQKGKENDLEKGHVDNAFSYGTNIAFSKTGKDIKAKCETQMAGVQAKIDNLSAAIEAFLVDKTGKDLPTEKPYMYGRKELIKCPYKRYHYCLTEYWEGRDINSAHTAEGGIQIYPAASMDEATTYGGYNRLVSDWIEEMSDMQFLNLFAKNLDDAKKYELNAEQMLSLGF